MTDPLIRNISDTALWVAVYRARETERPDALFRDPYARRLAGARGEEIASSIPFSDRATWAWVARTVLFDRFIADEVRAGADLVVNLAAGLDARPYRMDLPPSLKWVEVDLPGVLSYKEEILADAKPVCALERVRLDLSDGPARRALFERLGRGGRRALIVSEGLLIYLEAEDVAALARDLAAPASFRSWVLDLASPGLLRMIRKDAGERFAAAGAALRFGPAEGPGFFLPHGWRPVDVRTPLKEAARHGRLPLFLRLLAMLPESSGAQGSRPWSGVCLFERG
ncbi:MAG TPA: SAM-dependent methyltransferase [Thermoanaerobaculia bacterium]|nr:SAM-dependent methyltransferase [Thermoanaerobaculia bacterium]